MPVMQHLSAAKLRRDMKRARKSRGLSTDLKAMIAEYRKASPEYADRLELMLYSKSKLRRGEYNAGGHTARR